MTAHSQVNIPLFLNAVVKKTNLVCISESCRKPCDRNYLPHPPLPAAQLNSFFSQKYQITSFTVTWNEPASFLLHCWIDRFNAFWQEMSHLAHHKAFAVGLLWWGDTRCHSLIEWWLSWMEPPVFSLCDNMLMQMNANAAVLYMQISHATTLWFLFFRGRWTVCGCSCLPVYVWVYVRGVCVKTVTSTRLQMQSILCLLEIWKSLLVSLHDSLLGVKNTPTGS